MTKAIIPRPPGPARGGGGVLHRPEALGRYPGLEFVVYNRASSWSNATGGRLHAKTNALVAAAQEVGCRVREFVQGVEPGQIFGPRKKLVEAARYARAHNLGILAGELSRLIRAVAYDRHHPTRRDAWPSPLEFAHLRRRTFGVPLVTLADPLLSESARHSLLTKCGKPGRKRTIDDGLALLIFQALGPLSWYSKGERWETPIRQVAKEFGVSPPAIERALRRPSPSGESLYERALREAHAGGRLELREFEDGSYEVVPTLW